MATVTLHDGRQVDSWSEDWRHECEARAVLALPSLAQRRAFLYGVEGSVRTAAGHWVIRVTEKGVLQHRGESEVRRLEATMTALWSARRAAGGNRV